MIAGDIVEKKDTLGEETLEEPFELIGGPCLMS